MNDFETRLRAGLEHGAESAPDAAGLASGARARATVRRRRRVVAGVAAAVAAIVVPVAALTSLDGAPEAVDPASPADTAYDGPWQTVARENARADLPGDWREFACTYDGSKSAVPVYGPADSDPCELETEVAAFYGSATFDAAVLPGVLTEEEVGNETTWGGYVTADSDTVLWARTTDRDLTLQILASARAARQPQVVADEWLESSEGEVSWTLPAGWGIAGTDDGHGYGVVAVPRPAGEEVMQSLPEQLDEQHVSMFGDVGAFRVTVTAPTQAVAELVLSSVEASDDPTPPDATGVLQHFEAEGIGFDAPASWAVLDCGTGSPQFGPGFERCGRGDRVTFLDLETFGGSMEPGEVRRGHEDGVEMFAGYQVVGDWAVVVVTGERELTRQILGTIRPIG